MLKIEITPWNYSKVPDVLLKVSVSYKGETVSYEKRLPEELFQSTWERMMEEAKQIIKVNMERNKGKLE